MKSYGQFCPLALSCEIVGERWTLLVLREILSGSTRFNEIHRGVPRMSPALLAQRLRALQNAGIIERGPGARANYRLTEAGAELGQVIEGLAVWGKTWLPATLSAGEADPDLIMWDMHRRMDRERMPQERTVIRFDFTDQPEAKRLRWIVGDAEVELCIVDPGYEVDVYVETDSRTLTWVWYGDIPLSKAIAEGMIVVDGPRRLREAFPGWLLLNPLAPIPRWSPSRRGRPGPIKELKRIVEKLITRAGGAPVNFAPTMLVRRSKATGAPPDRLGESSPCLT